MYSIKDIQDKYSKICVAAYNIEEVKILNKLTIISQMKFLEEFEKTGKNVLNPSNYPYGFTCSEAGSNYCDLQYYNHSGYEIIGINDIAEVYKNKIEILIKLPKTKI